ncbi:MAG: hypothetical protein EXQ86_03175 [Rhodospirillales bacterium]|nr:hypothetical protein [Rhodospirillales bacterium]
MTFLSANTVNHVAQAATVRMLAGALAILFGTFLVLGAGFAQPSAVHNAAHDARHAFSFPCH